MAEPGKKIPGFSQTFEGEDYGNFDRNQKPELSEIELKIIAHPPLSLGWFVHLQELPSLEKSEFRQLFGGTGMVAHGEGQEGWEQAFSSSPDPIGSGSMSTFHGKNSCRKNSSPQRLVKHWNKPGIATLGSVQVGILGYGFVDITRDNLEVSKARLDSGAWIHLG
ncbi:hypothetical protein TURU_010264 [Turdus rufiventris]|nr:hypothetical protein TURU_010264 [Turdus rufiventris]